MTVIDSFGIDTNILIYADDPENKFHSKAKRLLDEAVGGGLKAYFTHQILAEYFSAVTNRKRVIHPLSPQEAAMRVLILERSRRIKKVYPKRSTLKRAIRICADENLSGPHLYDIIYGVTLLDNGIHHLCTMNVKDFIPLKEKGLKTIRLDEI